MNEAQWQILVVDDDDEALEEVKDYLSDMLYEGMRCSCIPCRDFEEARRNLETRFVDLVVLDIRVGSKDMHVAKGEEAGIRAYQEIRAYQFVPVIFRSNVSYQASDLERRPWVSVVNKSDGLKALDECIREVMASHVPRLQRGIKDYIRSVLRDTLWYWADGTEPGIPDNEADSAYFLIRHLGRSLEREMLGQFFQTLGITWDTTKAHPIQYYLKPPVGKLPMSGDLFTPPDEMRRDGVDYCVLVTPTCDIFQKKLEFYTFLPAYDAVRFAENKIFKGKEVSNNLRGDLSRHVKNAVARYFYLPGALGIPALFVDMQRPLAVDRSEVDEGPDWERVASIDSPFAQTLVVHFSRYFGRLGIPDLDFESAVNQIVATVDTRREAATS